jgi:outer membrane protein OmpA-like peptidoglycan-associated protein
LIPEERAAFELELMRLTTVLQNNQVRKVTLDCWASSDGATDYNMRVSLKRCAWVRNAILQRALINKNTKEIEVIEAPHGEDNPPNPEPAGITEEQMKAIEKLNRVVILKIYTQD